jgi:hypothetical protein
VEFSQHTGGKMVARLSTAFVAFLLLSSNVAMAQEKTAVKPGFTLPQDKPFRILVFRPDVKVGSQSAGGVVTPNAEWTRDARKFLAQALASSKPGGAADVVFMPDLEGNDATLLADYRALFRGVSETVLQHRLFKGNRLPTKKTGFEYTLGPDVAKLGVLGGGDYGLFIRTDDAYGSAGRKMLQFFAAGIAGVGVSSGKHSGYAGLVDLKSGDLVWFNADYKMGGDVRDADGSMKRVGQLLEEFPAPTRAATK